MLRNLPEHLPKGWPVEVTYEYLTNGRLDVHAKIPGTSRQIELELQREQSLTSERVGRWKKIVEEAKGFDAFDDMLDDVANAHRIEKRKDPMSPAIPTKAAMPGPARSTATASAAPPPAPVSPSRDLSAASRAFGAFADALDEPAKSPVSTGDRDAIRGVAVVQRRLKARIASREKAKPEPAAKGQSVAIAGSKKPMTLMEAAAAKAGASIGFDGHFGRPPRAEAAAAG